LNDNSYQIACTAAKVLDNKLAKDITILNISNVSTIADYFVICSAESNTQVNAFTGYVEEALKKTFGLFPKGTETDQKNRWHLIDYGDVIVHVMHKEERQYYTIEKFWSHACKVSQEEWEKEAENIKID